MLAQPELDTVLSQGRTIGPAQSNDTALGPFSSLVAASPTAGNPPGVWTSDGHGWNMVALPFFEPKPGVTSAFRLLVNQFNENLTFFTVDKGVPNRGAASGKMFSADQTVAALQYIQDIPQVAADDFPQTPAPPASPTTPKGPAPIHHEPGLLLHLLSEVTETVVLGRGSHVLDIARMATIPHGDAVLAMGFSSRSSAGPDFDALLPGDPNFNPQLDFSPLPVGVDSSLDGNSYLAPYKHFHSNPFRGNVPASVTGFPGFDPTQPLNLLKLALDPANPVVDMTTLVFSTKFKTGGIHNIPFVTHQANATSMIAIFWIETLRDGTQQLQYAQKVMLEFFNAKSHTDSGLIQWPHISINTLKLS